MTQFTVFGGLGYGKTMLMVYFAYLVNKISFSFLAASVNKRDPWFPISVPKGREDEVTPVIANFPIDLPNCRYVKVDEFLDYEGDPYHKTIALIDEAKDWGADSRRSSRGVALAIGNYVTASRKVGVDLFFGTQLNSMLDKRIRGMNQALIWALRPDSQRFNYHVYEPGAGEWDFSLLKSFCVKKLVPLFRSNRKIVEEYSDDVSS